MSDVVTRTVSLQFETWRKVEEMARAAMIDPNTAIAFLLEQGLARVEARSEFVAKRRKGQAPFTP